MLLCSGLVLIFFMQCSANSINDGPLSRWADLLFDDVPQALKCGCKPTGDPNGSLSCKCRDPQADLGPGVTPSAGGNVPPNLRCQCGPLPGDTTGALACQCKRPPPESSNPQPTPPLPPVTPGDASVTPGGAPVTPGGAPVTPGDAGPVPKKTDNPTPQFDVVTPPGPIGTPPPGPGSNPPPPNVGTPPPPAVGTPPPGPSPPGPSDNSNQNPNASGPVSTPVDDDFSGEAWTYVVCARRRSGLGKPYWEWLYDQNGDYYTVTGKWTKQQCAYGGVDPFLISRTIYSTILRQCRYKGYETAQPANGLHSYWYPFQVDLYLTEYFREKTWFSFERFPQMPVNKC